MAGPLDPNPIASVPNGNGPVTGDRWYTDEITGTQHPESLMVRDSNDRLRYVGELDAPDIDELRDGWHVRTEESPQEP